jgi:putative transposase
MGPGGLQAKEGLISFYQQAERLPGRFRLVLASFLQQPGLPFADVLPAERIQTVFDEEGVSFAEGDQNVYTPPVTLWAFLSQVLFKEEQRSCLAAVARVVMLLVALGRKPCSNNTGAYCRARAKLSERALERLTREVAYGCQQEVTQDWLWHGRHVQLVDGTTVSMPDTPENQAAYPQNPAQKQGLGFPIVRMVVLLSLATAMLSGMALGPYQGKETGELALFRELLDQFREGDVLLADRHYCTYFMIALLLELRVDFVVRLHQRRPVDFRRGERLGKADHLVTWIRPARPEWMDQATYDRMPRSIEVREVFVRVNQPGFRTESLVVVTSLTDAHEYPHDDLAELYHRRWLVELDIRAIKISLGMDVLRCQTPEMVRKEIWTCLLAYNLIRQTVLQAARRGGRSPRQLSFSAAMEMIAASWMLVALMEESFTAKLVDAHLANLAQHRIGDRPNRVEPRAIKRRPKEHRLLTKPRAQARAELLAGAST